MHKILQTLSLLLFTPILLAQPLGSDQLLGKYDVSSKYPFGRKHPDAPPQIADYQPMIGKSSCTSTGRNKDGTWQKPIKMDWVFKYIMNGTAVQDETYKEDGSASGSIRQFDSKSGQWYVHFYNTLQQSAPLRYWAGKREKNDIVLTRQQKSYSGKEGYTKLTFHGFKPKGFEWLMQWISADNKTVYAVRKISCVKSAD